LARNSKNATSDFAPCAPRNVGSHVFGVRGKLRGVILSSQPALALRHLIRYYYQVRNHLVGRTATQPVPARSPQAIEFTFGTPYEVRRLDRDGVRNAYPIALIGAQTFRRVELVMQGRVDAFTIVFQPGGIFRLFSIPAETLTNDDFDGEAVLGRKFGELERRMADVASFTDRVRIADEYLCARLPALACAGAIAHAASEVLLRGGCVRVSDLAHAAGLGIRQFERRFRYEIGIPPKLYTRIVRFEAALQRKSAAPETQWTNIAHALGYHDQMHMVHDFNRLSGDSPTGICGQLDMFVHPELASADRPR
jgi:AraC-like DNA-binding protein